MHRPSENLVRSTQVTQELSSDHFCVVVELNIVPPSIAKRFIETRKIKAIDRVAFQCDISAEITPARCPTAEALNSALIACLDRHAPLIWRRVRTGGEDPWYPAIKEKLREAKQKRRRAEREWIKSGLCVFKQIYNTAKRYVTSLVHNAKTMFYTDEISNCQSTKQLFSVCNHLCGKVKSSPLPTSYSLSQLPNVFCEFFHWKNCQN